MKTSAFERPEFAVRMRDGNSTIYARAEDGSWCATITRWTGPSGFPIHYERVLTAEEAADAEKILAETPRAASVFAHRWARRHPRA